MHPILRTIILLVLSNAFMTFAWYAHLKHLGHKPWIVAAMASWGIALFEYLLQVPANRVGYTVMSLGQLKILQEVITLTVFVPFALIYMRQPWSWNFVWAGCCLLGAVYFMFRDSGKPRAKPDAAPLVAVPLHSPRMQARTQLPILLAAALWLTGCATPPPPAPPPAASAVTEESPPLRRPLPMQPYSKWKQSFLLTNATMQVAIVPVLGRIMHISSLSETNFLRNAREFRGKRPKAGSRWINAGGDWLWPVAQHRWKDLAGADWPPPPVLGESPWEGTAWANADGSQSCLLMRKYEAPLHLVVTRLITLDPKEPRLRILQRALRVGESEIPVTLWNITQCLAAERVFIPADSALTNACRVLAFTPPAATQAVAHAGVVVFDARQGGETKLGSGAPEAWIAAQRGGGVILERARWQAEGPQPDASTVELYSNGGLGYSEIETLTPEVPLKTGDTLENTIHIECVPMASDLPDNLAAARIKERATR